MAYQPGLLIILRWLVNSRLYIVNCGYVRCHCEPYGTFTLFTAQIATLLVDLNLGQ